MPCLQTLIQDASAEKEDIMHDIDRTQLESDQFEFTEESEFSVDTELESPFDETEEMELAAELLEITDEAELDQFLGKLFKKAWKGLRKVGSFVGRVARPLGGILKGIAKKALPFVGGALGSFIPIPGVGTAVGTALGSAVSKALEMEFEGMNTEDREFEAARRFVRLAGTAAKQAVQSQPSVDPQAAAKAAVIAAVRRHVPGATGGMTISPAVSNAGAGHSGRWIRRGRKIILLGI
jgi:uncharacterized protein (DUF697 family)